MKKLITIALLTLSTIACAGDKEEGTLLALSKEYMDAKFLHASQKILECTQAEKPLPVDKIKALKIPTEDLRNALNFMHLQYSVKCSQLEVMDFIVAASIYAKQVRDKEVVNRSMAFLVPYNNLFIAEYRYQLIDQKIKDKLETITELKSPFNIMDSIEPLGLM